MKLNRVDDKTAYENLLVKYAELEKKLEQTEKDLTDYQFNYPKIKELEEENLVLHEMNKKRLDLQKKNAELEEENNKLLDVINNQDVKVADLEKENEELKAKLNFSTQYYLGEKAKDQLAKAKEYITEFMRISCASVEEYEPEFSELIGKAEQFLKEI